MMIAGRKMKGGKQNVKKNPIPNPFLLAFSLSWEDAAMNHSFNLFIYFRLCACKAWEKGQSEDKV